MRMDGRYFGGIETTCHWSLDVTYGEHGLRTRQRTIAQNLAWLRRFTLSLLKQHPGKDWPRHETTNLWLE